MKITALCTTNYVTSTEWASTWVGKPCWVMNVPVFGRVLSHQSVAVLPMIAAIGGPTCWHVILSEESGNYPRQFRSNGWGLKEEEEATTTSSPPYNTLSKMWSWLVIFVLFPPLRAQPRVTRWSSVRSLVGELCLSQLCVEDSADSRSCLLAFRSNTRASLWPLVPVRPSPGCLSAVMQVASVRL